MATRRRASEPLRRNLARPRPAGRGLSVTRRRRQGVVRTIVPPLNGQSSPEAVTNPVTTLRRRGACRLGGRKLAQLKSATYTMAHQYQPPLALPDREFGHHGVIMLKYRKTGVTLCYEITTLCPGHVTMSPAMRNASLKAADCRKSDTSSGSHHRDSDVEPPAVSTTRAFDG